MIPDCTILVGDAVEKLEEIPAKSVQCVVSSPPYYGLRDYGDPRQIGLEDSLEGYINHLLTAARGIRRAMRDDGTFWLNLGDSYFNYRPGCTAQGKQTIANHEGAVVETSGKRGLRQDGLKEKDLMGIPWRVALALQADGWWLRSEIIWHKRNCMPESVTDRPTRNHEQIFLLTKSQNYFYDAEAIKEPISESYAADTRAHGVLRQRFYPGSKYVKEGMIELQNGDFPAERVTTTRNKRTVWTITADPYPDAHFATYPPDLIKPCIMAGTSTIGCCAKCRSPWKRITETEYRRHEKWFGNKQDARHSRGAAGVSYNEPIATKTIGWEPTCDCGKESKIIPCTVLDPFAGSGTTGEVALELGRSAILIELNPTYVELIKKRTHVTPGLPL